MTLEDQLRETFAAHESLADPQRAQEIARTASPRARRWPALVAAASVVVVVAGVAAYVARHEDGSPMRSVLSPPRPPAPHAQIGGARPLPTSDARNRAATAREATRLLRALPLPHGSVEHATSPIPALQHSYVGTSTSNGQLDRTTWWTVPVTDAQFTAWLRDHRPPDTHVDEMGVDSSHSNYAGRDVHTTLYLGPATTVWGPPTVVVTHTSDRGETAVRIDVEIAARFARTETTLAGDHVTSIEISRTVTGTGVLPGRGPLRDQSVTVTQPSSVAALAAAFDQLPGALDTPGVVTGGLAAPVSDPQVGTYRVTFRSPGSWLTATWEDPDYSGMLLAALSRDNRELTATLDLGTAGQLGADGPGAAFKAAVERALGG